MLWGSGGWKEVEIGGERERKRWKSESEKVKVNVVKEVNGERGEFDEYGVCSEWQKGQKVKRSKGQKWLFVKRDGLMPVSWLLLMPVSWIFWYKISSIYNKVVLTRVHY